MYVLLDINIIIIRYNFFFKSEVISLYELNEFNTLKKNIHHDNIYDFFSDLVICMKLYLVGLDDKSSLEDSKIN